MPFGRGRVAVALCGAALVVGAMSAGAALRAMTGASTRPWDLFPAPILCRTI